MQSSTDYYSTSNNFIRNRPFSIITRRVFMHLCQARFNFQRHTRNLKRINNNFILFRHDRSFINRTLRTRTNMALLVNHRRFKRNRFRIRIFIMITFRIRRNVSRHTPLTFNSTSKRRRRSNRINNFLSSSTLTTRMHNRRTNQGTKIRRVTIITRTKTRRQSFSQIRRTMTIFCVSGAIPRLIQIRRPTIQLNFRRLQVSFVRQRTHTTSIRN